VEVPEAAAGQAITNANDAEAPEATPIAPVNIDVPDPAELDSWLTVLTARKGTQGGWATGDFNAQRNKITINTRDVQRFVMDVSRLPINWDRPVVLRIDGYNSELRRRKQPKIVFDVTLTGEWVVVKPD